MTEPTIEEMLETLDVLSEDRVCSAGITRSLQAIRAILLEEALRRVDRIANEFKECNDRTNDTNNR